MADIFNFTDVWTVGGTTYDAIKVDVTDTASAAASLLLNLSVGGSVKASVRKDGHIVAVSEALGGATIGTHGLAVTGTATLSGNLNFGTAPYIGFGASFTADATLSRNAAGVIQFGTTAANASGAWLAAKGTLTGGTLADQAQVLSITATQPASPTGTQSAAIINITGAGSAAQTNRGFYVNYGAGYTGVNLCAAMSFENANAGTGTNLALASSIANPTVNAGVTGFCYGTTTGYNVAGNYEAGNGVVNVGLVGKAVTNKNSGTNIGGIFTGLNGGSSPVQVGLFAALGSSAVPTVSAALIADNGAQTDPIMLLRDNGSTVFSVIDGGFVGVGTAASTSAQMIIVAGTTAKSQIRFLASTAPTSPVDGDWWFDGTDLKIRVSGATKTVTII